MHANSFFLLFGSSAINALVALVTSSLLTGPTVTYETGMFSAFKNVNKASKDPKVDAATPTP